MILTRPEITLVAVFTNIPASAGKEPKDSNIFWSYRIGSRFSKAEGGSFLPAEAGGFIPR